MQEKVPWIFLKNWFAHSVDMDLLVKKVLNVIFELTVAKLHTSVLSVDANVASSNQVLV